MSKKSVDMDPNVEEEFMVELEKMLNDTKITPGKDGCLNCKDILRERSHFYEAHEARPAYHCDHWDHNTATCWLYRNVGNTVTFVLSLPPSNKEKRKVTGVEWSQMLHTLPGKKTKRFVIDQANPPWNMVVGSRGYELRLSPITEVDLDYNFFRAELIGHVIGGENHHKLVNFRIRVMAVDQGLVYPGASLLINMHSFVSLPEESMTYHWVLEKEPNNTLPSNMRLSLSGAVLSVSELRKEQEGIVVCNVYTDHGVFATQKRFLIRGVDQENNLLVFEATRPPYRPETRRRRSIEQFDEDDEDSEDDPDDDKPSEDKENSNRKAKVVTTTTESDDDESDPDQENESEDTEELETPKRPELETPKRPEFETPKQPEFETPKRPNSGMRKEGEVPHKYASTNRTHHQPSLSGVPRPYDPDLKNVDNILAVEVKVPSDSKFLMRVSDKLSMLMSSCRRNTQCSTYAECTRVENEKYGFCRCLPRFEGPGVFCWEVVLKLHAPLSVYFLFHFNFHILLFFTDFQITTPIHLPANLEKQTSSASHSTR